MTRLDTPFQIPLSLLSLCPAIALIITIISCHLKYTWKEEKCKPPTTSLPPAPPPTPGPALLGKVDSLDPPLQPIVYSEDSPPQCPVSRLAHSSLAVQRALTAVAMEGKSRAGCGWAGFLLAVACMAVVVGRAGAATAGGAPSASVDCNTAITSLVDCLSYVQNGSKEEKPVGTCCVGLKKVVKTEVSCLCEAFKSSADFGVPLNITKALALPAACGVSTPSVSKCKIAGLGTSPAPAPQSSSQPAPAPAPSPSARGGIQGVPAPAPMKAAAPAISMPSMAFLLAGLAIAACLCL